MNRKNVLSAATVGTAVICICYYILCGLLYSFDMTGLWIWPSFALILIFGVMWRYIAEPKIPKTRIYRSLKHICLEIFSLFMVLFLLFELCVGITWIKGCGTKDESADCAVILGAAVDGDKPGAALSERISTAFEYLTANPELTAIVCGGLSPEDEISEAECIRNELVSLGISEDRITIEAKSSTTYENFRYAARIMPVNTKSVAIVTSGFHQLRSIITAKTAFSREEIHNVKFIPVSADYNSILLPYSAVREFAAFVSDLCHGIIELR